MSKMEELLQKVNKTFKDDIMHVGLPEYEYERIPFTSPRLNYMTYGGLPIGRLIEFYGSEHGGKTTTALDVVANYQNMPNSKGVLYADCENTLDVEWARKLGVDVDSLFIMSPTNQSAEQIFNTLLQAIETDEIGLIVIDSLGVMVSQQALDKTVEDKTYGGISKALTDFSSRAAMSCAKFRTTLIGINQVRDDMNSMYGGTTTPGGRAWKHNCSVRLEFRLGTYFDHSMKTLTRGCENPAGNYVDVAMKKNKTCPPNRRTGFYTLNYLTGIDYIYDLIEVAVKDGIIEQKGAWFTIIDTNTGEILADKLQGQTRVYEYLSDENNINVLSTIESILDNKIKDFNI